MKPSRPAARRTSYGGLAEGSHTFVVKATDTAGNTGPEASYTWTIDTIAPTAAITTSPADPSNDPSPSFHFGADEAGATFACKLDGGEFGACSSPKTYAGLADGSHTFRVKATDAAGNTGGEAAYTWRIDTVAPDDDDQRQAGQSEQHEAGELLVLGQRGWRRSSASSTPEPSPPAPPRSSMPV